VYFNQSQAAGSKLGVVRLASSRSQKTLCPLQSPQIGRQRSIVDLVVSPGVSAPQQFARRNSRASGQALAQPPATARKRSAQSPSSLVGNQFPDLVTSDVMVSCAGRQTLAHCPQFTHSTFQAVCQTRAAHHLCPRCEKSIAPIPGSPSTCAHSRRTARTCSDPRTSEAKTRPAAPADA